jgi:hypothetical protein
MLNRNVVPVGVTRLHAPVPSCTASQDGVLAAVQNSHVVLPAVGVGAVPPSSPSPHAASIAAVSIAIASHFVSGIPAPTTPSWSDERTTKCDGVRRARDGRTLNRASRPRVTSA